MPAPPGNTNALKHGLYAKRFTRQQRAALKQVPENDLTGEIASARVVAATVFSEFQKATDPAMRAKLANSFIAAVLAIGTLITRHAIHSGQYGPLQKAIEEVFDNVDPYLTDADY